MAAQSGVRLEREAKACGATPWDPELQEAFAHRRLIVHEEFVLDGVLDRFISSKFTD